MNIRFYSPNDNNTLTATGPISLPLPLFNTYNFIFFDSPLCTVYWSERTICAKLLYTSANVDC